MLSYSFILFLKTFSKCSEKWRWLHLQFSLSFFFWWKRERRRRRGFLLGRALKQKISSATDTTRVSFSSVHHHSKRRRTGTCSWIDDSGQVSVRFSSFAATGSNIREKTLRMSQPGRSSSENKSDLVLTHWWRRSSDTRMESATFLYSFLVIF